MPETPLRNSDFAAGVVQETLRTHETEVATIPGEFGMRIPIGKME